MSETHPHSGTHATPADDLHEGDTAATPHARPTRWRRLRFTPLRDLLRLRLSGRLDVEARLAAAHLSPDAAALLRRVVNRTRLWRGEKLEIADELIAHFRDGRDAGQSDADLIGRFGDPATAARLIRRAKRRNRPWAWQAFVWCRRTVVLLLVLYAVLWLYYMAGQPVPSVDYVATVNARAAAVPLEDRGWPILRAALLRLPDDFNTDALYDPRGGDGINLYRQPEDVGWDQAGRWLDGHAWLIDAIREAAAKPGFGLKANFPGGYTPQDAEALRIQQTDQEQPPEDLRDALFRTSLHALQASHLNTLRMAAGLVVADALHAADDRNVERVMRDMEALPGLSRHAGELSASFSEQMVARHLNEFLRLLAHLLDTYPGLFSADQLQDLADQMTAFDAMLSPDLAPFKALVSDTLQRIYDSDGKLGYQGLRMLDHEFFQTIGPDGVRFTPGQRKALVAAGLPLWSWRFADQAEAEAKLNELWPLIEAEFRAPLWEDNGGAKSFGEAFEALIDDVRYLPVTTVLTGFYVSNRPRELTLALRDALGVVIAAKRYRADHGRWPGTIDALVPRYLPTVPPDRSTGLPLILTIRDGRPWVYGRGWDGVDDGGIRAARWDYPRLPPEEETHVDWVLFPPASVRTPLTEDDLRLNGRGWPEHENGMGMAGLGETTPGESAAE